MTRRLPLCLLLAIALPVTGHAQEPPVLSGAGSANYQVGPNDVFEVVVLNEDELTRQVQVAQDGSISLGYIGNVFVEGLTAKQIADKVQLLYVKGEYLRNPQVFVTIKEYKSQVIQVFGGVRQPGQHRLTGPSKLLEVLGQVGGISEAGGTRLSILREVDAKPGEERTFETIDVDLQRLMAGDTSQNYAIRARDVLFIPRADEIYVLGEVKNPGAVKFEDGLTLTQAISKVAGFTRIASYRVQIVRMDGSTKRTFDINVGKIQGGKVEDFVLRARDLVVVPESYF